MAQGIAVSRQERIEKAEQMGKEAGAQRDGRPFGMAQKQEESDPYKRREEAVGKGDAAVR